MRQSEEHPFLGREIAQPRHFSEQTAHAVDVAIRRLVMAAEARVIEVIEAHRANLDHLIVGLEMEESLDRAAIDACLGPAEVRAPAPVNLAPAS